MRTVTWTLAAALLAAEPASAAELAFTAKLAGDHLPTLTGSKATGQARIVVDTTHQTVDLTLEVAGLKLEDLWSQLVPAPMGPIHLHRYGSHDHSDPNAATLVFPAPYGPGYAGTRDGFRVEMRQFPYATAAALVKSDASFNDFVDALNHGGVVINVHTNAQHDGEISGDVVPATS